MALWQASFATWVSFNSWRESRAFEPEERRTTASHTFLSSRAMSKPKKRLPPTHLLPGSGRHFQQTRTHFVCQKQIKAQATGLGNPWYAQKVQLCLANFQARLQSKINSFTLKQYETTYRLVMVGVLTEKILYACYAADEIGWFHQGTARSSCFRVATSSVSSLNRSKAASKLSIDPSSLVNSVPILDLRLCPPWWPYYSCYADRLRCQIVANTCNTLLGPTSDSKQQSQPEQFFGPRYCWVAIADGIDHGQDQKGDLSDEQQMALRKCPTDGIFKEVPSRVYKNLSLILCLKNTNSVDF